MIDPDEFYDHLEACVQAAGGAKAVGQLLWPDKSPDAAHRLMLDCLNPDRPAKLAPEQLLRVLRLARDCGYHGGVGYILESLQYLPTRPQSLGDQVAEIQTQLAATARSFQGLVMRVERLTLTAGGQGAHG